MSKTDDLHGYGTPLSLAQKPLDEALVERLMVRATAAIDEIVKPASHEEVGLVLARSFLDVLIPVTQVVKAAERVADTSNMNCLLDYIAELRAAIATLNTVLATPEKGSQPHAD